MKLALSQGRLRAVALLGAILALVALLAWFLTQFGPLAPVKVTTHKVQFAAVQPAIFGVGTVEARTAWTVGPTVTGRVLRVLVDVGDTVQAGQLMAEMDPLDFQDKLAALDAAVLRARSGQTAARAQLDEAQARQQQAALNAKRNEELATQQFISASALEARQTEWRQAKASVAAAQANLDSSAQDIARLQAERAAATQVRSALRMVAPAAGLVLSRDAEPGSTVLGGQPVIKLIDPASLWVRMRVDQGRSTGLATGLAASVVLRSHPGAALPGHVARVEVQADSVTEERIAQVVLDQNKAGTGLLTVGELAEVTLTLPETAKTLVLPNASVHMRQGQAGVWRLQADKPQFVSVRLGSSSLDGTVQVLQGLAEGELVIVHSQSPLRDGLRVRVQDSLGSSAVSP